MKILIVSEMSVPYAVGGGEVRYALLARELVRRGHTVTWLSMRQRQSPDEEMIDGVRHLHRGPRIANPPSRPLVAMLRFMVTAFFHILTHRYDVIDTQTYAPLPPVWLACLLSRQKMVATIHDVSRGGDGQWMSNRFRRLIGLAETVLYRIPYPQIIAVSQSTADALVQRWGVAARRVHVVPNGIELPPQPGPSDAPARDIDLIYAGRFVPTKNIEDLIEVVRILHAAGAVGRVALVGEGPLWDEMVGRSRAAGLADVIDFTGRKSNADVLEVLHRAKVFFHASSREGFPVVMVEAMACGLPVVAYRIPGVVDVIEDGETGTLVAERDTTAHATECLRLLKDSTVRQSMSRAGRDHCKRDLTLEQMAADIERIYSRGEWRGTGVTVGVLLLSLLAFASVTGFRQPPFLADDYVHLAGMLEQGGWPLLPGGGYFSRLPIWYVANWLHFQSLHAVPALPTAYVFFTIHAAGFLLLLSYVRRVTCPSVPGRLVVGVAFPFLLYPCNYEVLLWPTCMTYTIGLLLMGAGFAWIRPWGRAVFLGLAFLDSEMFVIPAIVLQLLPMLQPPTALGVRMAVRLMTPWLVAVMIYAGVRTAILLWSPVSYPFQWAADPATLGRQVVLSAAGMFAVHFYQLCVVPTILCWLVAVVIFLGLRRVGEGTIVAGVRYLLVAFAASGCHWAVSYPAVRALYGAQEVLMALCCVAVAKCVERNPRWGVAGASMLTLAFGIQFAHVTDVKMRNARELEALEADVVALIDRTPDGSAVRLESLNRRLVTDWVLPPDYWAAFARYAQLKNGRGDKNVEFVTVQ